MTEIIRINGYTDWIELDFVEWNLNPSEFMKIGIRYHLSKNSLRETVVENWAL